MADIHKLTEDEKVLHGMGYAQELTRRMGAFQNFAISFAIICIVAGGITAFPVALSAGRCRNWHHLASWLCVCIAGCRSHGTGRLILSNSWSGASRLVSILGGRGFWLGGGVGFNLLGLIFVVSSVNWGLYNLFRDLFLAQVLGMDVTAWVPTGEFSGGWWIQTIFIAGVTALQAI